MPQTTTRKPNHVPNDESIPIVSSRSGSFFTAQRCIVIVFALVELAILGWIVTATLLRETPQ